MAALLLLFAAFLGGCEQLGLAGSKEEPWTPDATAYQVESGGSITETILDRLDQAWYSASELEEMVRGAVSDYAKEHGAPALTLEAFAAEGESVSMTLRYAGGEDVCAFNNEKFFSGTMLGAQMENWHFRTPFYQVKNGEVTGEVSGEEALSHKEYQVVISDLAHVVEVPGVVVYVSTNAHPDTASVVRPGGLEDGSEGASTEAEAGGLELPSSQVYTPPTETVQEENDEDGGYYYVIYQD